MREVSRWRILMLFIMAIAAMLVYEMVFTPTVVIAAHTGEVVILQADVQPSMFHNAIEYISDSETVGIKIINGISFSPADEGILVIWADTEAELKRFLWLLV